MKLADEQTKSSCLPSAALHPWHSSGGFGYPSDSFGRSAPILNAASRSAAKLSACFQGRPLASDEARRQAAESLLGSVNAQRFLAQLRAPRLMVEMTRAAQNGTIPRPKPCDELQVEQRHLRPMKLADEPQSNATYFSSAALHP